MVTSRIPIPLAILGVLLSAGTAGAQKTRYTRQQDIKIDAKLSERSRPIAPKDPKDQTQADQPLTADQVLAVEGLVGAIRRVLDASGYRRIDTVVRDDFAAAHRFARRLGFVQCGLFRRYGADGSDFAFYERIA